MIAETYAELKARIDRERSLKSVWTVEEVAAQEQALREKWVEEFGTDPDTPVTHLYREEGQSGGDSPMSAAAPVKLNSQGDPVVEPISQVPVAPKPVKPSKK